MDEPKNENNNTEIDKLTKCEQEKEEYLNNWKRERADFLNYKKDEIKRLEEFIKFANEAIVLEVIEILDDLEKAETENTEKKEERIEEVRAGYMMQGKVIRPARVKIVK